MLKILVCVKQVPDVDMVKMDPNTGNLVRDGVPSLLNPLDTNAMEAALRVREQFGGTVTVVTMGPPAADTALRECIAMGADNAVLISGREFGGADTLSTSYVIAQAMSNIDTFDLVFCGKESLDGATGQMASQLAERFNSSQVSCMDTLIYIDEEARLLTAKRIVETGTETVQANLPCLITVEKANFRPRVPGLKGKMAAKKAQILVLGIDSIPNLDVKKIGVAGSGTIVPRIYPPILPEPGEIITAETPDDKVNALFSILHERELV